MAEFYSERLSDRGRLADLAGATPAGFRIHVPLLRQPIADIPLALTRHGVPVAKIFRNPGAWFWSSSCPLIVGLMFRTLAVLIVLAVPGAQDASLLCQTWCSRPAEASTTCHHQEDSATRIRNARSCDSASLEATLVPRSVHRISAGVDALATPPAALASTLPGEGRSVIIVSRPAVPAFTRLTVLRI